uniref:ATP-dependent DNA helicase RecQ zinc-binding domain-containing protein n=1 Tax=Glycine max TaxID=3847 RepID=A0A0R0G2N0_SOYBN
MPLIAFNQIVEYCEGSGCRRKRILKSFAEQVTVSLCGKTCDACRHPNLVARCLEDFTTACALRQKNGSSRIFRTSSTDAIDREQLSEFWNQDEEANGSEEDIPDSDGRSVVIRLYIHVDEFSLVDGNEFVNNLTRSKLQSKLGVNEKLAMLQRAEENFYRNNNAYKQSNKVDKNAISDPMRGASRQRLQNALKQVQQRLDNFKVEMETSASLLKDECYKKYGKAGKSFYYLQVASTLIPKSSSFNTKLPQIPSFSEFVNSRKAKGDQLHDTKKHSSRVEKKMRI